jgi:hypothetical protein
VNTHFCRVVAALAVTFVVIVASAMPAFAGDTPAGFNYGADGSGPGPTNPSGPVPYVMPTCGGAYGSYIGRVETFPDNEFNVESYSNDANANSNGGYGIGSSNYYELVGPQGYNTASAATGWGKTQANTAVSNFVSFYDQSSATALTYPVLWAALETKQGGWTSNTALNRDVLNGFLDIVTLAETRIKGYDIDLWAGVYTTNVWWNTYMTGTLSGTFEWTAQTSVSLPSSSDCASGWTSPYGNDAVPYAGYTTGSACMAAWQWVSGAADYDQMDSNRIQAGVNDVTCN